MAWRFPSIPPFRPLPALGMLLALYVGVAGFLVNIRNLPGDAFSARGYADALTQIAQNMAKRDPAAFAGDVLLGDEKNFLLVNTIDDYLSLCGDFFPSLSHAFFALGIPMTLGHLVGFFLLGRKLGGHPAWGWLLALAGFATIVLPLGHWAIHNFPRSTGLFTALLPFFLLTLLRLLPRPDRWPWFFLALGLSSLVHQVSAPFVGFALWCGLFAFRPVQVSHRRFLAIMLLASMAFVVGMLPSLWPVFQYLQLVGNTESVNYQEVMAAARHLTNKDVPFLTSLTPPLLQSLRFALTSPGLLLPLAICGGGVIAALRGTPDERRWARGFLLVGLGLILSAGVAPWLEFHWAARHERFPVLFDAPRSLIYLLPLLLIGAFLTLRRLESRLHRPGTGLWMAVVVTIGWWSAGQYGTLSHLFNLRQHLHCLSQGSPVCSPEPDNAITFAQELKSRIPKGGRIFSFGYDYVLKVMVERPMVFSNKDFHLFYKLSKRKMVEAFNIHLRIRALRSLDDPLRRISGLRDLARELGADYFVLSKGEWNRLRPMADQIAPLFPEMLYADETGALYRL